MQNQQPDVGLQKGGNLRTRWHMAGLGSFEKLSEPHHLGFMWNLRYTGTTDQIMIKSSATESTSSLFLSTGDQGMGLKVPPLSWFVPLATRAPTSKSHLIKPSCDRRSHYSLLKDIHFTLMALKQFQELRPKTK